MPPWLDDRLLLWLQEADALLREAGAPGSLLHDIERQAGAPPVLALVGAFDAGKSSLLKRLCVDDGVPVPERLAISAEPTTSTVDEAHVGEWTIRDTPGLDSEHEAHAGRASKAALPAERVWLLVLPNLFTEESETGWLLRALEPGTVEVVLSRADKPVMTPSTAAINSWAAAKANEARLLAARLGHPDISIHVVAADPRGRVGNRPATPERYDATREWDGVAGLRRQLDTPCPPSLRRLAAIRQARLAITKAREAIQRDARENELALDQAACEATERELRLAAIERLEAEARPDLREALTHAARIGPSASARARVLVAADHWLDAWGQKLAQRAHEWGLSLGSAAADLAAAAAVPAPQPDKLGEAAADIDLDSAERALRERLASVASNGDNASKLERELKAWEKAKRESRAREHYNREDTALSGIRDVREAKEQIRSHRRRQTGVAIASTALDALKEERKLAAQAKSRADAARVARDLAEALAVAISRTLFDGEREGGGFRSMFDSLRDQTRHHEEEASHATRDIEARQARSHALDKRLAALATGPR